MQRAVGRAGSASTHLSSSDKVWVRRVDIRQLDLMGQEGKGERLRTPLNRPLLRSATSLLTFIKLLIIFWVGTIHFLNRPIITSMNLTEVAVGQGQKSARYEN